MSMKDVFQKSLRAANDDGDEYTVSQLKRDDPDAYDKLNGILHDPSQPAVDRARNCSILKNDNGTMYATFDRELDLKNMSPEDEKYTFLWNPVARLWASGRGWDSYRKKKITLADLKKLNSIS